MTSLKLQKEKEDEIKTWVFDHDGLTANSRKTQCKRTVNMQFSASSRLFLHTSVESAPSPTVVSPTWRSSPTLDALRAGTLTIDRNSLSEVEGIDTSNKIPKLEDAEFFLNASQLTHANAALLHRTPRRSNDVFSQDRNSDSLSYKAGPDGLASDFDLESRSLQQLLNRHGAFQSSVLSVQLAAVIYRIRELCSELQQYSNTVWFDYRRCWQEEKRYQVDMREARARVETAEESMRQMQNSLNMYKEIERVRSQGDDRQEKVIEDLRKFLENERQLRFEADEFQKRAASAWAETNKSRQYAIEEAKKDCQVQKAKAEQLDVTVQQLKADLELERAQRSEDDRIFKIKQLEFQQLRIRLDEESFRCKLVEHQKNEALFLCQEQKKRMEEKEAEMVDTIDFERRSLEYTEKLLSAATESLKAETDYAEAKIAEEICRRQAAERAAAKEVEMREECEGACLAKLIDAQHASTNAVQLLADIRQSLVNSLKPWDLHVSKLTRHPKSADTWADDLSDVVKCVSLALDKALDVGKRGSAEDVARIWDELCRLVKEVAIESKNCEATEIRLEAACMSISEIVHAQKNYQVSFFRFEAALGSLTDDIIRILHEVAGSIQREMDSLKQNIQESDDRLNMEINMRQKAEERFSTSQRLLKSKDFLCEAQQRDLERLRQEAIEISSNLLQSKKEIRDLSRAFEAEKLDHLEASKKSSEEVERYRLVLAKEKNQHQAALNDLNTVEVEIREMKEEFKQRTESDSKQYAAICSEFEKVTSHIQHISMQHLEIVKNLDLNLDQVNHSISANACRPEAVLFDFEVDSALSDSICKNPVELGRLPTCITELESILLTVQSKYAQRDHQMNLKNVEMRLITDSLGKENKQLEHMLLESRSSVRSLGLALDDMRLSSISRLEAEEARVQEAQHFLKQVEAVRGEVAEEKTRRDKLAKSVFNAQRMISECNNQMEMLESEFSDIMTWLNTKVQQLEACNRLLVDEVARAKEKFLLHAKAKRSELDQKEAKLKEVEDRLESLLRNFKQKDEVATVRTERETLLRKEFEGSFEIERHRRMAAEEEFERLQAGVQACKIHLGQSKMLLLESEQTMTVLGRNLDAQRTAFEQSTMELADRNRSRFALEEALEVERNHKAGFEDILTQQAAGLENLLAEKAVKEARILELQKELQDSLAKNQRQADSATVSAQAQEQQHDLLKASMAAEQTRFHNCARELELCEAKLAQEKNLSRYLHGLMEKANYITIQLREDLILQGSEIPLLMHQMCDSYELIERTKAAQQIQHSEAVTIALRQRDVLDSICVGVVDTELKLHQVSHSLAAVAEREKRFCKELFHCEAAVLGEQEKQIKAETELQMLASSHAKKLKEVEENLKTANDLISVQREENDLLNTENFQSSKILDKIFTEIAKISEIEALLQTICNHVENERARVRKLDTMQQIYGRSVAECLQELTRLQADFNGFCISILKRTETCDVEIHNSMRRWTCKTDNARKQERELREMKGQANLFASQIFDVEHELDELDGQITCLIHKAVLRLYEIEQAKRDLEKAVAAERDRRMLLELDLSTLQREMLMGSAEMQRLNALIEVNEKTIEAVQKDLGKEQRAKIDSPQDVIENRSLDFENKLCETRVAKIQQQNQVSHKLNSYHITVEKGLDAAHESDAILENVKVIMKELTVELRVQEVLLRDVLACIKEQAEGYDVFEADHQGVVTWKRQQVDSFHDNRNLHVNEMSFRRAPSFDQVDESSDSWSDEERLFPNPSLVNCRNPAKWKTYEESYPANSKDTERRPNKQKEPLRATIKVRQLMRELKHLIRNVVSQQSCADSAADGCLHEDVSERQRVSDDETSFAQVEFDKIVSQLALRCGLKSAALANSQTSNSCEQVVNKVLRRPRIVNVDLPPAIEGHYLQATRQEWASALQEIQTERDLRRCRDQLYMTMQEELSVMQAKLKRAEMVGNEAQAELQQQRALFEMQLQNLMNACKAEEIVGDEARKREAEALAQLSISQCRAATPLTTPAKSSGSVSARSMAGYTSAANVSATSRGVDGARRGGVYSSSREFPSSRSPEASEYGPKSFSPPGTAWAWSPGHRTGSRTAR